MNLRSIEFLLEEAFNGIRRNGLMAFASISTIALSLGVLGSFVLAAKSANNFAAAQIGRFEIAVFLKEGKTMREAESVAEKLRIMTGVGDVTILDRDKEWLNFKSSNPEIEAAGLPRNVLPYTLNVKVSDPERLPAISSKVRLMSGVRKVQDGGETRGRVMALAKVIKAISVLGVLVLLVTSAFIISNAIRLTLYARRREIRIMQLVGATNEFIRIPLVIEGVVFGTGGAIVAWALLHTGSSYLSHVAQKVTPMLSQFSSGLSASGLAAWLIILGMGIGAAGSFVSIRRFLRD